MSSHSTSGGRRKLDCARAEAKRREMNKRCMCNTKIRELGNLIKALSTKGCLILRTCLRHRQPKHHWKGPHDGTRSHQKRDPDFVSRPWEEGEKSVPLVEQVILLLTSFVFSLLFVSPFLLLFFFFPLLQGWLPLRLGFGLCKLPTSCALDRRAKVDHWASENT